jgi:tetratricopeptide (TPR) repeat protein
MIAKDKILLVCLILSTAAASVDAKLPKEQIYSLYNQANKHFRQGNSTSDSEQAKRLYEKAILSFERIIEQGQIKNAKLHYNLGNAYFLKGDIGKAILNYRRAAKINDSDENIKKNLAFARSQRTDKITVKTEKRVLQTLFFWHYDFSIKTKFLFICIFFGIVCISITATIWFGRSTTWTLTTIICGIVAICLFISLVVESRTQAGRICGVITVKEVIARQGDGQNYPPSFKDPLHEGTEFDLLEDRLGWLHIKLFDDSDAWIPDDSAELI